MGCDIYILGRIVHERKRFHCYLIGRLLTLSLGHDE